METIHIYHTNDLHSYFANWPQVVDYLNLMRAKHQQDGEQFLFMDIGDHMDRANLITEGSMGKANIALLNQAHVDYITIGNNEGITFTKEGLNAAYEGRSFQIIVANLFNQDGSRPTWANPYIIHQLESGLRIGLIGVTAPFADFYEPLGWQILDPLEILPNLIHVVREQSDIVILMSHLGLSSDQDIARKYDGIDVILGAHTHHVLSDGLEINNTLIGQAGKFGTYIGKTTLQFSHSKNKLIYREMKAIKSPKTKNNDVVLLLDQLMNDANKVLKEVVATINKPMPISWFERSPFAEQLAIAVREWCQADCSMINSGLILGSLNHGDITKGHLHEICPHPINPCTVHLTGQELVSTLERAHSPEFEHLALKGFGFRGVFLGKMVYDRIDYRSTVNDSGRIQLSDITINQEPVDYKKVYTVATVDMFTFGEMLPQISHATYKQFFLPEMLRDLLAWRFKKMKSLNIR